MLGGFDSSLGAIKPKDIQPYIDSRIIDFPGETKDPVSFYQNCSVFVLPSYYREGLPRTILEAMSCGRAVITTDWPGCREPIIDGNNGYLVPIKNVQALADKMFSIIESIKLLEEFSNNAFFTCLEKYDVTIVNNQMRSILKY